MDGSRKNVMSQAIESRKCALNSKEIPTYDSQSVCSEKTDMSLCDVTQQKLKCEGDTSIFNLDSSVNSSEPESETSKEVESCRSFDFFLEGERLVSSLCGPKIEDTPKQNDNFVCDKTFGRLQEDNHADEMDEITPRQCGSYGKLIAPTSSRNCDYFFKQAMPSIDRILPIKLSPKYKTESKSTANTNMPHENIELQEIRFDFSPEFPPLPSKDEFKAKPLSRNWGVLRRSPLSDLRRNDDGSHHGRKYEKSFSSKIIDTEHNLPSSYLLIGLKNENDSSSTNVQDNDEFHCAEESTRILSRSKEYSLCFANNSKTINSRAPNEVNCIHSETSDDEISFRKSAIEGSLVFEQLIRDFQLKSHGCDLESYCRNVKRCVGLSITNSFESDRAVVVMTELIMCALKLADSWSTLNSYFGAKGDIEYKPKSEDDCRLFNIFKEWQVSSKVILDCLIVVIQNLKNSVPKVEKSANANLDHQSSEPGPKSNPFSNMKNSQLLFSGPEASSIFDDTDCRKDTGCSKLLPENSGTSSLLNVHNHSSVKQSSLLPRENNDPANVLFEIQQKAQSLVRPQSLEENKPRKKWTLTSAGSKKVKSQPNYVRRQSLGYSARNQTERTSTFSSTGSFFAPPAPQITKSIFENVPLHAMNFMSNPFGLAPQNANSNTRDYISTPQLNFSSQPTGMSLNAKQSLQNKDITNVFKCEEVLNKELSIQSTSSNQASGLNRAHMCNQQHMNLMSFPTNFNPQPLSFPNDQKNKLIYRTNFCFPDSKMMQNQTSLSLAPASAQQSPSTSFFYPPFCSNEMYKLDSYKNQLCQDKRLKMPIDSSVGEEVETYAQIKSYMKPGSYRVPSKCASNTLLANNNLNYISEDIAVTGITVPLTKTESFSPTKKTNLKSNVAAGKKSPPMTSKQKDSTWKAAVASAEELSKFVENFKIQAVKKSNSQESLQGAESSKLSATESVNALNSENESKQSGSPSTIE